MAKMLEDDSPELTEVAKILKDKLEVDTTIPFSFPVSWFNN
jgi:hypothetical protein